MKDEILRLEQVTLLENDSTVLDNFTMGLFSGEILGLICVNFHGQAALIQLIEQNIPIHYGFVYLGEKLVNAYGTSDRSYNQITVIEQSSRLVEDLTVADNIFVLRPGFKKWIIQKTVLEAQVQRLCRDLGVWVSPGRRIGELNFYERCVTALLKAYVSGSKLVVLRDISNFMSASDLKSFHKLLRIFTERGIGFLYLCNHHEEVFEICHRAALMEDGKIKKVLESNEMTDKMISFYSESFTRKLMSEEKKLALAKKQSQQIRKKEVLIVREVYSDFCDGVSFSLEEGECAVLLDTDTLILQELIGLLSCEKRAYQGKILIDGYPVSADSSVVFISENPAETMMLSGLSPLDNLCFQLDRRQRNIWRSRRVQKSIIKEYFSVFGEDLLAADASALSHRTRINLVYYRALLRKPKLVVCIQPFAQADMYMRSHIISLINQFKKQNIAFLILAVSTSDSLYVADRLLLSEKGRIVENYTRNELGEAWPESNINTRNR